MREDPHGTQFLVSIEDSILRDGEWGRKKLQVIQDEQGSMEACKASSYMGNGKGHVWHLPCKGTQETHKTTLRQRNWLNITDT